MASATTHGSGFNTDGTAIKEEPQIISKEKTLESDNTNDSKETS